MKSKKYFFFLLILVVFGKAHALDNLESGMVSNVLAENMWNADGGPFIPDAAVAYDENKYYWLFRGKSIGVFDNETKKNIDGWILKYWPHQFAYPEEIKRQEKYFARYTAPEYSTSGPSLGCYGKLPLRYGDIESDGVKELVLFLSDDLIVFSPAAEKIVFAERLAYRDWYSVEQTQDKLANEPTLGELKVQHISSVLADNGPELEPGYRGYSKLYFGDFNENGMADILVWRKLFVSRLSSDTVKGFQILNSYWSHYEKRTGANATGEYLLQETEQATIQVWLSQKQLTWQKGYPSQSECAGEQGQLIPEIHDALLNDPEVLQ